MLSEKMRSVVGIPTSITQFSGFVTAGTAPAGLPVILAAPPWAGRLRANNQAPRTGSGGRPVACRAARDQREVSRARRPRGAANGCRQRTPRQDALGRRPAPPPSGREG